MDSSIPSDKIPISLYIIGEARTNADNAITRIYGSFYMAFEVDRKTELVRSFNCTHTLALTEEYLSRLFLGKKFSEIGSWPDPILLQSYGGSSRRAIVSAYHDALKRFRSLSESESKGT